MIHRKRNISDAKEDSSSRFSTPRKRTKLVSESSEFPLTPLKLGSSFTARKLTHQKSFTPYPLLPSDSPSNPFGRKRTEMIVRALPPASSFKHHLALRFQFARKDVSQKRNGVYRVVRVPLSYTFTHLRFLIAWLFNTPGRLDELDVDYLFEVKSKVVLYSPLYKVNQIRSGSTYIKLSNVHDRGRWPTKRASNEEDELSEADSEKESLVGTEDGTDVEDEDQEWKWADEEEFTLGHVWPLGLDVAKGIIYHHSDDTQVHITLNRTVIPRQRGISNTPFVFEARGFVHLSPLPLPRPAFSTSILHTLSSSPGLPIHSQKPKAKAKAVLQFFSPSPSPRKFVHLNSSPPENAALNEEEDELTDTDADGEIDEDLHHFDVNHPFFQVDGSSDHDLVREGDTILAENSDEEEASIEDHTRQLDTDRWNEPSYAFALHVLRYVSSRGLWDEDLEDFIFKQDKLVDDPFENDDVVVAKSQGKSNDIKVKKGSLCDENDNIQVKFEQIDELEDGVDENEYPYAEEYEDADYYQESKIGSTPGLTNSFSSSSSLPPSSPVQLLSSSPSFNFALPNSSSCSLPDPTDLGIVLEDHYPNKKYSHTPAPPKKRKHRLRIKRLEKRLQKIKKEGYMTIYDSEVEEPEKEVDELIDDDVKWTKPVLKPGEIWDPFGDEAEV